MKAYLGLSAFTRGSAAALVVDGVPLAAAREELHSREREDARLPLRAARAALRRAGLAPSELAGVVFFEKPLLRFERELAMQLGSFPRSARSFPRRMALWLGERLWIRGRIAAELGLEPERVLFVAHDRAHAAAAFLPSPFEEAAVLVVDDACESATTALWAGRGAALEPLDQLHFPHSLALFAEAAAEHLGLVGAEALEALADLAARGDPGRAPSLTGLLELHPDGSFSVDARAFRFAFDGERATGPELVRHLGPARAPGGALELDGSHAALAAAVLGRVGDALLGLARAARARTDLACLCLCGRLTQLRPLVERVAREAGFEAVHVPPEPGDGGAALGAALWAHAARGGDARAWRQASAAFGEEPGEALAVREALPEQACAGLVQRLARGLAVGLAEGPVELAEPPLASRALLADPSSPAGLAALRALRQLEAWRAPTLVVRRERAQELLELAPASLRGASVVQDARLAERWRGPLAGALRADGSARVRLVSAAGAPALEQLLGTWERTSGVPALAADVLARRGAPVARTAEEAFEVLLRTPLAALSLGGRLYA